MGSISICKTVFQTTALLKLAKFQNLSLAPLARTCRVTDEALVAEIAIWPSSFCQNIPTALEGSQF